MVLRVTAEAAVLISSAKAVAVVTALKVCLKFIVVPSPSGSS